MKKIFVILLIGIMLISSFFIYKNKKEDKEQESIFEEIKDMAENEENSQKTGNEIDIQKLYEKNNDIVGWIKIENAMIDYPVMQTKDRPDFYLRRNFYKEYSYWGTPYLAESCDIGKSDNLIIYGHHINGAKMFGELEKYRRKDFYESHKKVKFYTQQENAEYEIIAVFRTVAYIGFPYYKFVNASSEDEFNTFVNKCKELSFYQTEEKTQYGDKFITLSTCDYTSKNGRFVVVAKRVF